jgi:hypothetical protein
MMYTRSVQRTNIYLDEEQVRALKHLAAEDRTTMAELIRRAVDSYIAGRSAEQPWRERLDSFLVRVRTSSGTPADPEAAEADVTAARAEVRQMQRAARGR